MKILVLTCEEDEVLLRLAREIVEGVREAGESPSAAKNDFSGVAWADLVFFGFTTHRRFLWNHASDRALRALKENGMVWGGKRVALFAACYGEASRAAMQDVVRAAGEAGVGARIANTLAIVAQKTKQGSWEANEVDLARARGFGERTTNNANGRTVFKHNEKRRIKKYLK